MKDRVKTWREGRNEPVWKGPGMIACCALLAICSGCVTQAAKAFDAAKIGQPWKDIPGRTSFDKWGEGVWVHTQWLVGENRADRYVVVEGPDGRVVAKGFMHMAETGKGFLRIQGAAVGEYMDVAQHWADDEHIAYSPTFNDPLPSGLTQHEWLLFSDWMVGWPFSRAHPSSDRMKALIDGHTVPWETLLEMARGGTFKGVVEIREDPITSTGGN